MLMDAKEFEFLYSTVIIFGLITFGIYLFLLKPFLGPWGNPNHHPGAAAEAQAARAAALAAAARRNGLGGADVRSFSLHGAAIMGGSPVLGTDASSRINKNTRWPPHVTTSHASVVDGLVSFRHTRAASKSEEFGTRDRARVLSKLLLGSNDGSNNTSATTSPTLPPKGSTWIMSLPASSYSYDWDQIRSVLQVLGTYYNLLVILALDDVNTATGNDSDNATAMHNTAPTPARLDWIRQLRQHCDTNSSSSTNSTVSNVSEEILPSHRIVATTTVAGRVAFVRQVQRVGMILDFDATVQEQLSRFGHKVVIYDPRRL